MENTNSLKDLARGVATTGEIPTSSPAVKGEVAEDSAPATSYVGDTPVIIAPVKKEVPSQPELPQAMQNVMETPTPSAVGLDMSILETPSVNQHQFYVAVEKSPEENVGGFSQADLDMLAEVMPDLSVEQRIEIAKPILPSRHSIAKDLIINMGFTKEEASTAATAQIRKKLADAYEANKNNAPVTGVVMIDKTTDPNDLGLTKEEHEKLEKVKKVRLVVVEDVDLAKIEIERPDEEHKADYVNSIEGSLSKYSVPLPMFGDFVGFKGAPLVQMVNIINYEDARIDEIISTKASLIYEKLTGGNILQKYDANGKNIMSYSEFANKFAYQDIDMALYGILCASSMEENSSSLTCNSCKHEWMQTYNLKSLLRLESITPNFKERVDDILNYKSNDIEMRKLYEGMRKVKRFKSPFSNNIYDMSYPTIARATNLLKRINSDDAVMTYLSAVALYLSRILLYNEAKGTYVEITAEETPLMLDTMKALMNEDVNMLATQIRDDLYYAPQFILPATCPSCGRKTEIPVSVDDLIFLIARDSMVEIDS